MTRTRWPATPSAGLASAPCSCPAPGSSAARDHGQALAVLRRAVEAGVNHIDTAQFYGPNVANGLIHEALFPYPSDLVLVTKVGAARDERGGWAPAQRPEELRTGVEANLRTSSWIRSRS